MIRRYDYTQRLYDEFISEKNGKLLGFSADGIKILTDDTNIYNTIYNFEVNRLKQRYAEQGKSGVYKIEKYKSFGLGENELSLSLVLILNLQLLLRDFQLYIKAHQLQYFLSYKYFLLRR